MRVIRLIVSDSSLAVSGAYSFMTSGSSRWWYVRAPRVEESDESKKNEIEEAARNRSDEASGATKGGTVEYRIRTANKNYQLVRESVGDGVSREEMLDMRGKRKSDRYC
jgi:hypothetical protein